MIDYQQLLYEDYPQLLSTLNADTPAQWGMMDAQQMVEHLAQILGIANGRFSIEPTAEPERLAYRKMRFFEKDIPFTQGIKVPFVSEAPVPHQFSNIEQAKTFLINQLERFYDYFVEHPDINPAHPIFGAMNYEEWVQFQARHFKHHFTQFGLLEVA